MLSDLNFSLQITTPIFFIIGLGFLFKRIGWLNDDFAKMGSALVFKVTLPCLLFTKLSMTDFTQGLPTALVIYGFIATLVLFLFLDVFATRFISERADKGVFVQGAFRSNMGIISLAFVVSAYGEDTLAIASIYLAVITILFNVLSVVTFSRHMHQNGSNGFASIFLNIGKNPLIISIVLGVAVSLLNVPVPEIALHTGEYFAGMTLPLALLCAGASIRIKEFHSSSVLYWSSAMKLIVLPLVITLGGVLIGLRGEELGVLYLMCASPTAAASYPMVQAMHGNHYLAAAIIAVTSIGSMLTTTLGIFLLKVFELI
ncbi:AEC family transporter [Aliiglaciecola sp. 2_MG-2023]|uniref:AEC family transporter n=1 Tax=unclassified Aliiglaciecola TaxID=2593648 RepID=UPI0026E1239A|nr:MULTISPECIES: AEC family transporter [unclassified Aliiglaciecola]MDO6712740.1 AEC family transporter [Aliiglaciecola sp. 2_MG-2023]MDO6753861.1 AEC family transporter [Aliiglaciecola sp. 1_MG-2023]